MRWGNCRRTRLQGWGSQEFGLEHAKFEVPFRCPSGYMSLKFETGLT